MNNPTFESGQYYTLSHLFSDKHKISIPDLQRDYCWGDIVWNEKGEKSTELVSGFVDNLLSLFSEKSNDKHTLGLIYGYESPRHHIQLCDGQQRITTLFLLLGMINRRTDDNRFQKYLISNLELHHDDKEPYLQYAIRESTLYFLSDLVCEFFLKNVLVDDIEKKDWYFSEYDLDASIRSMIKAIKTIDRKLQKLESNEIVLFGEFILNNLQMIYYDMENRTRGEETFVIINTTGEPLTATENLKPVLIGNIKDEEKRSVASNEWEKREEWFWKKRTGAGNKNNNVADNGVREFFRWIAVLISENDSNAFVADLKLIRESPNFNFVSQSIDLTKTHRYFGIVQFLFNENGVFRNNLDWLSPDERDKYINTQIVWFRLLPVIEYINRFGQSVDERKIVRVKNFFKNLSRIDSVLKNAGDLLFEAIRIIKEMPTDDIASILDLKNVSTQILRKEEGVKFMLYTNPYIDRIYLENCFWNAEEHKIWNGEILPLINWSLINGIFDVNIFSQLNSMFNTLFHGECNYKELDIVRRALLTRNFKQYPRQFRGYTNWSFCWMFSDWKVLISENEEEFGKFLSELNTEDYLLQLEQMIKNNPQDNKYDEFVKIPELLQYCEQKNIQWTGEEFGWLLVRGEKTSGEYAKLKAYRFYLELKEAPIWDKDWGNIKFWSRNETCAYLDHLKNVSIDIIYAGSDLFYIQLFRKKSIEQDDYKRQLFNIAEEFSFVWLNGRYQSMKLCKEDTIALLRLFFNKFETLQIIED